MPAGAMILAAVLAAAEAPAPRNKEDVSAVPGPLPYGPAPSRLSVSPLPSPAGAGASAPYLSAAGDSLLLSWMERKPGAAEQGGRFRGAGPLAIRPGAEEKVLLFARWDGRRWTKPSVIARGGKLLLNWADTPSLVALDNGALVAHWMETSGAGGRWYDYNIRIASSVDGGRRWSAPFSPHRDGTASEHGFVSLVPLSGGRLSAFWLDGRQTMAPRNGPQALYHAVYESAGFSPEEALDARVCDCCRTAAAATRDGALVAYRDRGDNELRDINWISGRPGRWSAPASLHEDGWKVSACPVNGPALAASGGRVAAVWFHAGTGGVVQLAYYDEAAGRFGQARRVDEGHPLGRADVALLPDGSALVAWIETTDEGNRLLARRVGVGGELGPAVSVAPMSQSRLSGFPRLARLGERVIVAWTDASQKAPRVRLAALARRP